MLIAKEIDGELWVKASDAQAELAAEKAKVENDLEVERMRLAACSAAALGYFNGCKEEYRSASLEDVLALNTKIADLTAQLAAKESAEHEPAAWMSPTSNRCVASDDISDIPNWTDYYTIPLYAEPTTTSAAVAAFKRSVLTVVQPDDSYQDEWFKAKADCYARVEALPADESALREICMRVAKRVYEDARFRSGTVVTLDDAKAIVSGVLDDSR